MVKLIESELFLVMGRMLTKLNAHSVATRPRPISLCLSASSRLSFSFLLFFLKTFRKVSQSAGISFGLEGTDSISADMMDGILDQKNDSVSDIYEEDKLVNY